MFILLLSYEFLTFRENHFDIVFSIKNMRGQEVEMTQEKEKEVIQEKGAANTIRRMDSNTNSNTNNIVKVGYEVCTRVR